MIVYYAIRAYQKSRLIRRLTGFGVQVHHAVRHPEVRPCPHAGACSQHFAEQARTQGGLVTAQAALAAMAVCGGAAGLCPDSGSHP